MMKLATLLGPLLVLTLVSPLYADFVIPFQPTVAGSIHDEPIDGLGDTVDTIVMNGLVSTTGTFEDRAIQEFTAQGVNMAEYDGGFFSGRIDAIDLTDVGPRTFEFYVYAGNSSVDASDFQTPALLVGTAQYHPPVETSLFYFIDASDEIEALLLAGTSQIGLRIEAGTNPSAGDDVLEEWGAMEIAQCVAQGIPYCIGTAATCPCANGHGGSFGGCGNTSGIGTVLISSGSPSFSNDTLSFSMTGVPGVKPGLMLRGDNQVSVPIADGLLCTAGGSMRSQVQVSDSSGTDTFTDFNGAPFGSVANSGSNTYFQYWYRDPQATCSGQGFNFSNGIEVFYLP